MASREGKPDSTLRSDITTDHATHREKDFGCVEWRQRGKVGFWRVKDCNRERKKNGLTGFNSIMCLYLISETSLRPKKTSLCSIV